MTNLWLASKSICPPVVWILTLYPPVILSVKALLPTSVKKKVKYVFLQYFYVCLISKHKTQKIQEKTRSKCAISKKYYAIA